MSEKILTTGGAIDEIENWDIDHARPCCRTCFGTGFQGRQTASFRKELKSTQGMRLLCHCVRKIRKEEENKALADQN